MNLKTTTFSAILLTASLVAAAQPTPAQLVDGAIAAQGGADAFHNFGVLKLSVDETETKQDGTSQKDTYTAYLDTSFRNSRLELANGVVVVKNDTIGWATTPSGKMDQRQNAPRFSVSLNHEKVFPLTLPYSLKTDGVIIGTTATETTFAGERAWSFTAGFEKMFFLAPFIADRWEIFVSKNDGRYLGARFLPREEYKSVHPEGMQFRPLKFKTIDGVQVPSQVVVDGIDSAGVPTSHTSVVKIQAEALYEPGITYFLSPEQLAELEDE